MNVIILRKNLNLLQIDSKDVVYVGDDPTKDFEGPRTINMRTALIDRQIEDNFVKYNSNNKIEVTYRIMNLNEIVQIAKA